MHTYAPWQGTHPGVDKVANPFSAGPSFKLFSPFLPGPTRLVGPALFLGEDISLDNGRWWRQWP